MSAVQPGSAARVPSGCKMWIDLIKLGGWVILLAYLANQPLVLELRWVVLYLAICVSVAALSVFVVKPILSPFCFQRAAGVSATENTEASTHLNEKNSRFRDTILRRPFLILLVPGEDGLFFVPLLLVGVTWLSALPVAVLFGLAHYNHFTAAQCASKAASAYLCCLFVLPHGILHFVVGHFLLDAAAFAGLWLLERNPAKSVILPPPYHFDDP